MGDMVRPKNISSKRKMKCFRTEQKTAILKNNLKNPAVTKFLTERQMPTSKMMSLREMSRQIPTSKMMLLPEMRNQRVANYEVASTRQPGLRRLGTTSVRFQDATKFSPRRELT